MRKFGKDTKKETAPEINKLQKEVKAIIKKFGAFVSKTRKDKGMKLQELSQKSGVSVGVISDLENGKEKIPNLYTLIALAKTLEFSNGEFLELIFGEVIHNKSNEKNSSENLLNALTACGVPCDVANNITASVQLFYGKEKLELDGLYSNPRARLIQQNPIDTL